MSAVRQIQESSVAIAASRHLLRSMSGCAPAVRRIPVNSAANVESRLRQGNGPVNVAQQIQESSVATAENHVSKVSLDFPCSLC